MGKCEGSEQIPLVGRSLPGTAPAVTRKPGNESSSQKRMKCRPKTKAFLSQSRSWGASYVSQNQLLVWPAWSPAADR